MRITYELTANDIVAANLLYHDHTQPTTRWLIRAIGLLIAFVCLMRLLQLFLSGAEHSWDQIGLLVFPIVLGPFAPWLNQWWMTWNARRHIDEDQLGTCTMEISGNRLLSRTRFSEAAIKIDRIKNIVEFQDYVLIYLGSDVIYVIPYKNVLPEEEYRAFARALLQVWESNGVDDSRTSEHITE